MARKRKTSPAQYLTIIATNPDLAKERRRRLDELVRADAGQPGRKLRWDRLREAVFVLEQCYARGLKGVAAEKAAAKMLVEMKAPAAVSTSNPAGSGNRSDEYILRELLESETAKDDGKLRRSIEDSLERLARGGRPKSPTEHIDLANARRIVRQVIKAGLVH